MQQSPGRLLAISDIHGHAVALERLLAAIQPTSADRMVFLGDYINKGPATKQVIDQLLALAGQHPDTIFLRGNHDQMMLDARNDAARIPNWEYVGGKHPLGSYGDGPTVDVL